MTIRLNKVTRDLNVGTVSYTHLESVYHPGAGTTGSFLHAGAIYFQCRRTGRSLADRNSRATIAGIVGTISYFTFTSHVNHMVSSFSFYLLFIFLGSLFCSFSQYLYLGTRYEIFLLTINTRKKIKRLLWEL